MLSYVQVTALLKLKKYAPCSISVKSKTNKREVQQLMSVNYHIRVYLSCTEKVKINRHIQPGVRVRLTPSKPLTKICRSKSK